jgi:putative oxidoreductase
MSIRSNITSIYTRFEDVLAHGKSPLMLVFRLYWGWQFAQNGWGKLQHISKIAEYFGTLHVPLPMLMAPAIASLELFGGVLLILGVLTRLTALLLVCDMIVAYVLADREALATAISSDPSKFLAADPFSFLCACLVTAVFGAGAYSLDHYLFHRRRAVAREAEMVSPH